MKTKFFDNNKWGTQRPKMTVRLTFDSNDEFDAFCSSIEEKANEFRDETIYLHKLLEILKNKKRFTTEEEKKVPVTYINAEDFHLLTLAFMETLGWF